MRRIITTAILGLTLLGGAAACADTADTATPGTTPSAAATSAAAAAGTADKAATCAAIKKLETDVKAQFLPVLGAIMAAATDPTKGADAISKFEKLITDSSSTADKIAADAADPTLKAALVDFKAENTKALAALKAAGTDMEKALDAVDADAYDAAVTKLTALCA
jgi:hypothetical protein